MKAPTLPLRLGCGRLSIEQGVACWRGDDDKRTKPWSENEEKKRRRRSIMGRDGGEVKGFVRTRDGGGRGMSGGERGWARRETEDSKSG